MNKREEMIQTIEKVGMREQGKAELLKHLNGEPLTFKEQILARATIAWVFIVMEPGRIAAFLNVPIIRPCHMGKRLPKSLPDRRK